MFLSNRKLKASEKTDYSIDDTSYSLIWARGQTGSQVYHNPPSGFETCKLSDFNFYK